MVNKAQPVDIKLFFSEGVLGELTRTVGKGLSTLGFKIPDAANLATAGTDLKRLNSGGAAGRPRGVFGNLADAARFIKKQVNPEAIANLVIEVANRNPGLAARMLREVTINAADIQVRDPQGQFVDPATIKA
ncbi:MAG: hypothetical protein HYV03_01935 [Deltaproteobacteria bacterium]|nr:hypothetical protein [Deltaproteobacteria bacterium]